MTLTFPGACGGAPLPPTGLTVTSVGNNLSLVWEPPATGPAVTGYVLSVDGRARRLAAPRHPIDRRRSAVGHLSLHRAGREPVRPEHADTGADDHRAVAVGLAPGAQLLAGIG